MENQDRKSFGFGVLCFFVPLVGLILFLVWKDQYPLKAKSCGIGAIIGVAGAILLYILVAVFGVAAFLVGFI